MNTTFSIRVDEGLKKSFLNTAKSRWVDLAILLRYFMQKISQNPDMITFDIDDKIFDDMFQNKEIKNKLEKISDKLDNLLF